MNCNDNKDMSFECTIEKVGTIRIVIPKKVFEDKRFIIFAIDAFKKFAETLEERYINVKFGAKKLKK